MTDLPNVIVITTPVTNNPFDSPVAKQQMQKQFKGAVNANGTWKIEPAAGWIINKLDVGLYRINHFQHTLGYSINLAAANGSVLNMAEDTFDVQITDPTGSPLDGDFSFAMSIMV